MSVIGVKFLRNLQKDIGVAYREILELFVPASKEAEAKLGFATEVESTLFWIIPGGALSTESLPVILPSILVFIFFIGWVITLGLLEERTKEPITTPETSGLRSVGLWCNCIFLLFAPI